MSEALFSDVLAGRSQTALLCGDCLSLMPHIPSASIDMILCDLPFEVTDCEWDLLLPFDRLWEQYHRVTKPNAAIVLHAIQPFTTLLIHSNFKEFRYSWIWDKGNGTGHLNAKKQPLRSHEDICVFSSGTPAYYPQKTAGRRNHTRKTTDYAGSVYRTARAIESDTSGLKYPKTILEFPKHTSTHTLHPTQKPVALLEYLIKTYTLEGDLILDNCMGSGSTVVAALEAKRRCIGIEKDPDIFRRASERVRNPFVFNGKRPGKAVGSDLTLFQEVA